MEEKDELAGKEHIKMLDSPFFALFLISCQGAVKSYQNAKTPGFEEDIYKEAIYKIIPMAGFVSSRF